MAKKSYKDILIETYQNGDLWNYYSKQVDLNYPEIDITNLDIFYNLDDCKIFIHKFFCLAGKGDTILSKHIDKLEGRAFHTVNTFLFGVYVLNHKSQSKNIKEKIDAEIHKIKSDFNIVCNIDFPYIWFLICLFHDLGYAIGNSKYSDKNSIFKSFDEFKLTKNCIGSNLSELLDPKGVPLLYKDIYEEYFNFILLEYNKVDHGIYAAFQLFSDLCFIRENEFDLQMSLGVNGSTLCWDVPLVNIYNYASWIILAHNIWFVNEDKKYEADKYENKKLDLLVLKKNERKINLNEFPFFFLFCLVDSIEPSKVVLNNTLLDKVQIKINKNELIIESNLECGCNEVLLNKAKDLNNWLTKTSDIINGNSVKIKLTAK